MTSCERVIDHTAPLMLRRMESVQSSLVCYSPLGRQSCKLRRAVRKTTSQHAWDSALPSRTTAASGETSNNAWHPKQELPPVRAKVFCTRRTPTRDDRDRCSTPISPTRSNGPAPPPAQHGAAAARRRDAPPLRLRHLSVLPRRAKRRALHGDDNSAHGGQSVDQGRNKVQHGASEGADRGF